MTRKERFICWLIKKQLCRHEIVLLRSGQQEAVARFARAYRNQEGHFVVSLVVAHGAFRPMPGVASKDRPSIRLDRYVVDWFGIRWDKARRQYVADVE